MSEVRSGGASAVYWYKFNEVSPSSTKPEINQSIAAAEQIVEKESQLGLSKQIFYTVSYRFHLHRGSESSFQNEVLTLEKCTT